MILWRGKMLAKEWMARRGRGSSLKEQPLIDFMAHLEMHENAITGDWELTTGDCIFRTGYMSQVRKVSQRHHPFHVLAKPTGAQCNLDCDYCYFLKKEQLYPGSRFRMSNDVMERYLRQYIEGQKSSHITISWQGGEPTLMGIDFFKRSIEIEKKYARPGMFIERAFQTNGILLNEEWCRFFRENNFLVGLSLDGPRRLHDTYRKDRSGHGTFDKVIGAAALMQREKVEFNILCTVNSENGRHPIDVYRFFRDTLGVQYIQFIPVVERDNPTGNQEGMQITKRSVRAEQWGRFLIEIFDEWVRRDVGKIFVQFFDAVLASYLSGYSSLCTLRPVCGEAVALEHNGDLYSCDHFVEPRYLLGNISEISIAELIFSERQLAFGQAKSSSLPQYCRECRFLFTCHGECPKNRVRTTPDGEPGLNWLCSGLRKFFAHADGPMQIMAELLRRGETADGIMPILAQEEGGTRSIFSGIGRNEPCPCGSGKKFKKCHGSSNQ